MTRIRIQAILFGLAALLMILMQAGCANLDSLIDLIDIVEFPEPPIDEPDLPPEPDTPPEPGNDSTGDGTPIPGSGPIYPPPYAGNGMSQVPPNGASRSEQGLIKLSKWDDGSLRGVAILLPSSYHGYVRRVELGGKEAVYAPWTSPKSTNGWRPTYRINDQTLARYRGQSVLVEMRDGTKRRSQPANSSTRMNLDLRPYTPSWTPEPVPVPDPEPVPEPQNPVATGPAVSFDGSRLRVLPDLAAPRCALHKRELARGGIVAQKVSNTEWAVPAGYRNGTAQLQNGRAALYDIDLMGNSARLHAVYTSPRFPFPVSALDQSRWYVWRDLGNGVKKWLRR